MRRFIFFSSLLVIILTAQSAAAQDISAPQDGLYCGSKTDPDKIYYLSNTLKNLTPCEIDNLECFSTPSEAEAAGYVLVPKNYTPPPIPVKDEIEWEKIGFCLGFASVFFIYLALALRALAKKYSTPRRWRAWIPFMNWLLFLDIAKKPRWWAWFIVAPLLFLIILEVFAPVPMPWAVILAILTVGSFIFQQILVALCTIAIAKSQGKNFAALYGLFMAFGQPVGAIMFGILAWSKTSTPLAHPQSNWRDLFRVVHR